MGSTVLCVDDDRSFCQIVGKALGGEGYQVRLAHDGDEALAKLRDEAVDLVLLDLMLPKRDGFAVLQTLRASGLPNAQVPVLILTACSTTPTYLERARGLAASALLTKPIPLDDLLAAVAKHAAGSKGSPRGLAGALEEIAFPQLLHHLHGLRASGVLQLVSGKKRKALQIRDGYPVSVKSNLVSECLGNLLVRLGRISQSELTESLQRMKRGEGMQGQILVAMQIVSEEEIAAALRAQAEEKLFDAFEWTTGRFSFESGTRMEGGNAIAVECGPAELILRGVRARLPLQRVDAFLSANSDAWPHPGESPFYRFQDLKLEPDEEELLRALDGTQPLRDLGPLDEAARRALYGLITLELVELRGAPGLHAAAERPAPAASARSAPETTTPRPAAASQPSAAAPAPAVPRSAPAPARLPRRADPAEEALRVELAQTAERLRGKNCFAILGVSESCNDDEVRASYVELAKRFHPDRFSGANDAVRRLAEEIFGLVSQAHEALADARRRTLYVLEQRRDERDAAAREEGERALQAELQFQKGEAALKRRDYPAALGHFGAALQRYPEEGEYHAHYGWVLYLCHPEDPTMLQEALEHVKRGAKLAQDREKPYLFLGRLYKAEGRGAAAEKMFTRAIQIQPDCVEALRELRLMNMRREKERGFVRRLLRR